MLVWGSDRAIEVVERVQVSQEFLEGLQRKFFDVRGLQGAFVDLSLQGCSRRLLVVQMNWGPDSFLELLRVQIQVGECVLVLQAVLILEVL